MFNLKLSAIIVIIATIWTPRSTEAEVVIFRDLPFSALGDAILYLNGSPESGTLLVSEIGSSGQDGVAVELPDGCCSYSTQWEPLPPPGQEDFLRFQIFGPLVELQEAQFGMFDFRPVGPEISMSVALPPGTSLPNQMRIYDGFSMVYHDVIDDEGEVALVGSWPEAFYVESGCSDVLRTSVFFTWGASTTVSVPNGPTITADSIEIISEAFHPSFSGLWMKAAGVPYLLVLDAEYQLPGSPVGDTIPSRLVLDNAVPNPFNPHTTIAFEIPRRETVTLRIFDMSGRLVRELISAEPNSSGRHEVVWNGKDDNGRQVASGTYFYRLEAGSYSETKRMVLIK